MLNSKYTIILQILISTKRMIQKGMLVDTSEFNEVQKKWLRS